MRDAKRFTVGRAGLLVGATTSVTLRAFRAAVRRPGARQPRQPGAKTTRQLVYLNQACRKGSHFSSRWLILILIFREMSIKSTGAARRRPPRGGGGRRGGREGRAQQHYASLLCWTANFRLPVNRATAAAAAEELPVTVEAGLVWRQKVCLNIIKVLPPVVVVAVKPTGDFAEAQRFTFGCWRCFSCLISIDKQRRLTTTTTTTTLGKWPTLFDCFGV